MATEEDDTVDSRKLCQCTLDCPFLNPSYDEMIACFKSGSLEIGIFVFRLRAVANLIGAGIRDKVLTSPAVIVDSLRMFEMFKIYLLRVGKCMKLAMKTEDGSTKIQCGTDRWCRVYYKEESLRGVCFEDTVFVIPSDVKTKEQKVIFQYLVPHLASKSSPPIYVIKTERNEHFQNRMAARKNPITQTWASMLESVVLVDLGKEIQSK